ncbi:hypothetical protein BRADI_2g27324v3 [Brachypodium distachyon]|uniref:Uncharacterized protein n=1 Tax=Brachypodium distachyon TaxID=15368 RepID=A0A0Q3K6Y1_BRADI|nr:hypothetical protein BRADI_2g27324v3 [Brachypodium distachyon]
MFKWAAYEQHRHTIRSLVKTLAQAAKRYKDRRLDSGVFYLVPSDTDHLTVHQALPRCRLELERRKDALDQHNKRVASQIAHTGGLLLPATRLLLWTTLSSLVLGCIIELV